MPAPKRPNTAAATAAVRRRGQETMAAKLRQAGWVVTPPEQVTIPPVTPPERPPADYVPYGERRTYVVVDSLDQLNGPTTGTVELPHHIDWSGSPRRDLDERGGIESMYPTVLAQASTVDDLAAFINRDKLLELWPSLYLVAKVRRTWEERFPALAAAKARAA
jgi:hypothetical protein